MNSEAALTCCALKYISGDSEHICRLCFSSTENEEVYLQDFAQVQKLYVEETITFVDMFDTLGVPLQPLLPQVLCMDCANAVINAYLFIKLCQYSNDQWNKVLNRLEESLVQSEKINEFRKSAYIMFNENDNIIYTSRVTATTKTEAANKIKSLLISKARYKEKKKKRKVYNCGECNQSFPLKSSLVRHVKGHNKDTKSEKVPCRLCAKYFTSKQQVKDHAERVHYPKTIQCAKCPKMFASEKMLWRHDKIHHIAAICKLCFVQFPSKNALRAHLDKHEVIKCEQCNKSYTNRHTYKLHLKICGRSDTRIHKFFCDLCNKGFARKNSLRTHLKTNHGYGNVLSCNWCKKKFDAASRLKMHIVKHTRERNFCCSQCGGKFVTQAALVYHTRLHTGEKPFPCDMCDESFLSASRRMEHKRRKHLEPSKTCIYCNAKFVTKHELMKHVARHTNPGSKLYVPLEPYNQTLPRVDDAYVLKFLS